MLIFQPFDSASFWVLVYPLIDLSYAQSQIRL